MPSQDGGKYRRSSEAEESQVGDRAVLYHRTSRKAVVLNPTGSLIWQLLATPQTTRTLAERLQVQFPALTEEQARGDVVVFLHELQQHGMILAE
jgi:hypothetical protein